MEFKLSIFIKSPPDICYAFFRDKDLHPQPPDSPVLALDKVTPGPVGVGTRYLEVVQMFPWVKGEIHSVITDFQPPERLAEDFTGAGMVGQLIYQFIPEGNGTRLIQREQLSMKGNLQLIHPLIRWMLGRQLQRRLQAIKDFLESGLEESKAE